MPVKVEMLGAQHWPVCSLQWSDQGLWHGQLRWPLEEASSTKARKVKSNIVATFWTPSPSEMVWNEAACWSQTWCLTKGITSGSKPMEVSSISFAWTKMMKELILELLFADDCALLAHTEGTQWLATSERLLKHWVWPSAYKRQRSFAKIPTHSVQPTPDHHQRPPTQLSAAVYPNSEKQLHKLTFPIWRYEKILVIIIIIIIY